MRWGSLTSDATRDQKAWVATGRPALQRTGMVGRSPGDKALMIFRPRGSSTRGLAQRSRNIIETVAGHILGLFEKLQWAS